MLVKLEEKPKYGSIVADALEKKVTALSDYSMSRYQSSTIKSSMETINRH